MRRLVLLVVLVTAAAAQDVFVGGRLDAELTLGAEVNADLGRDAGVDLTFSEPGQLDAYADISAAGGTVRLQELYARLPQTHKIADLRVGRFLLPHGDPRTATADRYAAGARDLFTSYRAWRAGNCLLDTDADGVELSRTFQLTREAALTALVYGAQVPGGHLGYGGRLTGTWRGFRLGASAFGGEDQPGADAWQAVAFGGWRGGGLEFSGQGFLGQATGGHHHGSVLRASCQAPAKLPLDAFVSRTDYDDSTQAGVSTTRFGLGWRFGRYYRAELRYELNTAPGAVGHDLAVARLTAVF